jgi:sn-glycerol 3-phosphate transport system substrate-binding protein
MRTLILAAALWMACAMPAQAVTDIQFWHSMSGALGDRVGDLAADFNKSQSEYKVTAVYKGTYAESMNAGIAAFRARNAPHLLQVFEVGTATMMSARGAIKPVGEVMKEAGMPWNPADYIPAVASYYTAPDGQILSFPFNSSTVVLYYDKDAFAKAGLDPEKPPLTWPQLTAAAAKLKASGERCIFTTGWQSWVQLENFSAWHNVEFASRNNGIAGLDARLTFNSPLHVRHIQNMAHWAEQGLFTYAGRRNEPEARFYNGECAMLTSSSAAYANILKHARFKVGISTLPYYADVPGAPQNTIIGGASLWVMAGKSKAEYRGVAGFLAYLSRPEVQAEWHQETGYLPITRAAYELTRRSGFYDRNPGADVSVKQMLTKTTPKSSGIRLGAFTQVRDVIDEELEGIWAGKQDAKTALDRAAARGNELLDRFRRANRN